MGYEGIFTYFKKEQMKQFLYWLPGVSVTLRCPPPVALHTYRVTNMRKAPVSLGPSYGLGRKKLKKLEVGPKVGFG